jgi:hypothetical protein
MFNWPFDEFRRHFRDWGTGSDRDEDLFQSPSQLQTQQQQDRSLTQGSGKEVGQVTGSGQGQLSPWGFDRQMVGHIRVDVVEVILPCLLLVVIVVVLFPHS